MICQKFQNKRCFNTYIQRLPDGLEKEATHFFCDARKQTSEVQKPTDKERLPKGHKATKKDNKLKQKATEKEQREFLELVEQKYLSSLAQPGEPVGIIAAQSIGEPSTQMTPDVTALVANVKKVCIADLAESMEVEISMDHKQVTRIYKLKMKMKDTEFVSLENLHATLKSFKEELQKSIKSHLEFLSKISGIKNVTSSSPSAALNINEYNSTVGSQEDINDDMDADGDERGEDLGSDVQKRKQQSMDEMDYDDGSEDEGGLHSEIEQEQTDQDHLEEVENKRDEGTDADNDDEASNMQKDDDTRSGSKSIPTPAAPKIYCWAQGLHWELHVGVHASEAHLLLPQIVQKTAKQVYIKNSGEMNRCKMVKYDADEKSVIWDEGKKPKKSTDLRTGNEDLAYWAIKASGVEFMPFWEMQDDLDTSLLYSNSIDAMLKTYGVEAARATIIREVKQVFDIYGVKVDYRHLSLIADYMTQTGGYRAMTRHGSIAQSLSPFIKMSFETASKFIVEAASRGMTDNLETPSSRICLGLPVKMGTGCFDLMQKLEI